MEWEKDGLKVRLLGFYPRYELESQTLKYNLGNFLGADAIVAFLQKAVSQPVSFSEGLETEIKNAVEKGELDDIILKKICSSVLRGHSLDGTAGIVLGVEGSKFIDPALTGLVNSRSFTTSGRRAIIEDIIIPDCFKKPGNETLKERYVVLSQEALKVYKNINEAFGEKQGPQIASKMMAYNSSGNLYIVLPISAIVTLSNELEHQRNEGEIFFPREIENLVDIIEKEVVKEAGMKKIYDTRKAALRDTYLHWNVFKAPKENIATDLANQHDNNLIPEVINFEIKLTDGFRRGISHFKSLFNEVYSLTEPEKIKEAARRNMLAFREFIDRYNDAVHLQTISSLSWRVHGEQKRHATLKQTVESIYMAADKAYDIIAPLIEKIWNCKDQIYFKDLTEKVEQAIVIPTPLKQEGREQLLLDYINISAKQIMFMKYLTENGIEKRDAIFILPRAVRLRTLETYDLYNLTLGELSLRLCTTCEPERLATSEMKEMAIKRAIPVLSNLIGPKCNLGYCTEPNYCKKMTDLNKNYNKDIHEGIRKLLLEEVKK
jgi:hypothetical protein